MSVQLMRAEIAEAVDLIRAKTTLRPEIGLILGSGLSSLAEDLSGAISVP